MTNQTSNAATANQAAQLPLYWRTRYGSLCERQTSPSKGGWMFVRRLSDDALREWNVSELTPVSDAEALAEAKAVAA